MAAGYRSIAWALNPRVPLAALLQRATATPAVPSLALLAAAALRRQLTQRLAELAGAVAEARNNGAAAVAEDAGGRRGGGSRRSGMPPSREGSGHGGSSYAAYAAAAGAAGRTLQAAVVARLSSGPSVGRLSSAGGGGPGASTHRRQGSFGSGLPATHSRHASESGMGSSLHGFQPPAPPAARAGSWRGRNALDPAFSPGSAPAGQELLCSSATASPAAVGLLSVADGVATASPIIQCARTATSVTSVAGEGRVCLR